MFNEIRELGESRFLSHNRSAIGVVDLLARTQLERRDVCEKLIILKHGQSFFYIFSLFLMQLLC